MRAVIERLIAWALERKPVRAALRYIESRGPSLADSITYRALFSIFAAVLLGFSVAWWWLSGNPQAWNALVSAVSAAIPGLFGPDGILNPDDIPESVEMSAGLSLAGLASLAALIGAALGAIGALRNALRVLAGQPGDDTAFYWVILRNIALAAGVAVAFVAAAALTFAGRLGVAQIAEFLGLDSALASWGVRLVSLVVVFALDAALIAGIFWLLSGVKASPRSLWPGALLGGAALLVLQELSSLFVGGASTNPLLASFAALIALLLWVNLSAQVILFAACYIFTGVDEEHDRVRARYSARTFAQHRMRQAEREYEIATARLRAAREAAGIPEV